jgi:hypothetical protein
MSRGAPGSLVGNTHSWKRRGTTDAGTGEVAAPCWTWVISVSTAWFLFPLTTLVSLSASALLVVRLERVAADAGVLSSCDTACPAFGATAAGSGRRSGQDWQGSYQGCSPSAS